MVKDEVSKLMIRLLQFRLTPRLYGSEMTIIIGMCKPSHLGHLETPLIRGSSQDHTWVSR